MKVVITWPPTTIIVNFAEFGVQLNSKESERRLTHKQIYGGVYKSVYNVTDEKRFMLAVLKYGIEFKKLN